jgi:hypothetical protein
MLVGDDFTPRGINCISWEANIQKRGELRVIGFAGRERRGSRVGGKRKKKNKLIEETEVERSGL